MHIIRPVFHTPHLARVFTSPVAQILYHRHMDTHIRIMRFAEEWHQQWPKRPDHTAPQVAPGPRETFGVDYSDPYETASGLDFGK